jgi:hypothetical protein
MDRIINFNILANPANWVIIFFVLYLAALIAHVMFKAAFEGGSAIQLPEGM